jgi:hypothetical protein
MRGNDNSIRPIPRQREVLHRVEAVLRVVVWEVDLMR